MPAGPGSGRCRLRPFKLAGSRGLKLGVCLLAATTTGVVLGCVSTANATAAALKVTTTADELTPHDGKCSLREAIAAANRPGTKSDCGVAGRRSNTIVLGAGHYALTIPPQGADGNASGDLDVISDARLRIAGAGKSATVIDATGLGDRVLSVASTANVMLSQLEITGGSLPAGTAGSTGSEIASCTTGGDGGVGGNARGGGGIHNRGKLTLERVVVSDNTAGAGGAGGTGGAGRGCSGGNGGQGGDGGGIYNNGTLVLTAVTIGSNHAGAGGAGGSGGGTGGPGGSGGAGGSGGGVYNRGKLSVTASTVRDNEAGAGGLGGTGAASGTDGEGGSGGSGGGILGTDGRLSVINSTFSGSFAGVGGAGGGPAGRGGTGGSGGAVQATAEVSALRDATLANNGVGAGGAGGSSGGRAGAAGSGGGLSVQSPEHADDLTLQNTIVASNVGSGCAGNAVDGGHDLSYGNTSCPGGNGNPELAPLRNYGGPTATLALMPGSAAIDRVPARHGACPATDQRGVRRSRGKACDIGAFEFATPKVEILSPHGGAYYGLREHKLVRFRCSEGGIVSPIATCRGAIPYGHRIDTRSTGLKRFTVTATDKAGNKRTKTVQYKVLPYTDPLKAVRGLVPGRIDMGVDYGGHGRILALGDGTVKLARDDDAGWPDGGWVMYRLSDGPFAGKYVYDAENITVTVRAGQRVKAGQQIAILHPAYPYMETGWAAGKGDKSLADVDGHRCPCGDPGGWSTIEGRNFDRLLVVLGAPSGYLQPDVPRQSMPPGWPRLHYPPSADAIPQSLTPLWEGWTEQLPGRRS